MSCTTGCGGEAPGAVLPDVVIFDAAGRVVEVGVDPSHARTCAVMCAVCVHSRGGSGGTCTKRVNGRPIDVPCGELIKLRVACPLGRHPSPHDGGGGPLRWFGVAWYGVPAPVRWSWWWLRRLHGVGRLTGELEGCGCVKRLKDAVEAWRARKARAVSE